MKIPLIIRFFFIAILPLWILVFVLTNSLVQEKKFASDEEELIFWDAQYNDVKATKAALRILATDLSDFQKHGQFLMYYTRLEFRDKKLFDEEIKKVFGDPVKYYSKLTYSEDRNERNIGCYGYVKINFSTDRPFAHKNFALLLSTITTDDLPFVKELQGDIASYNRQNAIDLYKNELSINPSNKQALKKLIAELAYEKKYKEAKKYVAVADSMSVKPNLSLYRFINYNVSAAEWIKSMYTPVLYFFDSYAALNAFLILLVWLFFILKLNIFKEIKLRLVILSVLLPLFICPLVMILYDYVDIALDIHSYDTFLNGVFVVGLFEEFIKLLPALLILLIFPKSVKSPFALFFAASVSAFVFAFEENILYFNNYYDLSIVSGRAVLSSTLHVITGGIAIYGVILYKYAGRSFWVIPLCFLIAIFTHGAYNHTLHTGFIVLTLVIVCSGALSWSSMVNNCLNNSVDFDSSANEKISNKGVFVIAGLSVIIMVEFLTVTFLYGPDKGREVYSNAILGDGWMVMFLAFSLARFDLIKGKWSLIDFSGIREISLFGSFIGKEIFIHALVKNDVLNAGENVKAKIMKKCKSANEDTWYLVETEDPKLPRALLKFKESGENFMDYKVVMLLRKVDMPELTEPLSIDKYPYIGFVRMSPV